MGLKDNLDKVIAEKHGKVSTVEPEMSPAGDTGDTGGDDFAEFMRAKPRVADAVTPVTEVKPEVKAEEDAHGTAAATTEPIGYDGKPVYDLDETAKGFGVDKATITNPENATDLIMMMVKGMRDFIYPGLSYKIFFADDEIKTLEPLLRKFVDIDEVLKQSSPDYKGSKEFMPLKKDAKPTEDESVTLVKWKKYCQYVSNLKYTEKEENTVRNFIYSQIKDLPIDSLIARFGPWVGLFIMETGKLAPFFMQRKQSLVNTYTHL